MFRRPTNQSRYACVIGRDTIVLDVRAQRYYALHIPQDVISTIPEFLEFNGISVLSNSIDMNALLPLPAPSASRPRTGKSAIPFVRAVLVSVIGLKLFGSDFAIQSLKRLKTRHSTSLRPASSQTLPTVIQAFRLLRPWLYTAHKCCLLDSLILSRFLTLLGYNSMFVVGVRTRPFEAHAWVQSGLYVLDDRSETVQLFNPIYIA